MVLMSPVIVASAVSNMLHLLSFLLAPPVAADLEVASEEACLESFNSWFYPGPFPSAGDATAAPALKRISALAASKRASAAAGGATSRRESRLSTASDADTLNTTTTDLQLLLPLEAFPSVASPRLSTLSTRVSRVSTGSLPLPGCTELAGHEYQRRESQGSPRPSASVPGILGAPEAEAGLASLLTHALPSSPASKVTQGRRADPPAACDVPQPTLGMPALRHVVPRPKEGQEREVELLLGGSSTVKALVGVWETRGKRIQEQVKRENADRKMRALRPCRSLPARQVQSASAIDAMLRQPYSSLKETWSW